jgi:hypothetical protein
MPQGLFLVLIVHLKIFMKSQVKPTKWIDFEKHKTELGNINVEVNYYLWLSFARRTYIV